ncbi:MAG TPA: DUF1707 domain-containing protein [Streptosporangiaceae bacterium]
MANEPSSEAPGREVLARENLRASHEDRDQTVEQLRVAAGDGRIDAGELEQRVEAALTARTYGQLAALVADLPTESARGGTVAPRPKDDVRIDCRHGNSRREGRWAVPQRMTVEVRHGNVILDFTEADVAWPTLQLDVDLHHSNLVLITKPGILIDADALTLESGNSRIRPPRGPEVPATLRVDLAGRVRHSNVVARAPHRSFWAWLLHRPPRSALPAARA